MALTINTGGTPVPENTKIADRRLWFTDTRDALVEDEDPRAAFLACAKGDPIPNVPILAANSEKSVPQSQTEDKAAPKSKNKGKS